MKNRYPHRSESHQIGYNVEEELKSIFRKNGWIVEPINEDYGEDFMVQVIIKKQVLPLRVYIQSKGTKNIQKFKKKNYYSYSGLKRTTVTKWIESNDSTAIILWDVNKHEGVFDFVEHAIDTKKFYKNKHKTITAKLATWKKITGDNLEGFTKESLEDYLHKRQMFLEGLKTTTSKDSKEYKSVITGINNQIVDVILLYLANIGILKHRKRDDTYTMNKEFRNIMLENSASRIEQIEIKLKKESEIETEIKKSIMVAIFEWHKIKYNHPVHENILLPISELLFALNKEFIEHVKKIYTDWHTHQK